MILNGRLQERDKLIDYWTARDTLFGPFDENEQIHDMGETESLVMAYYLGETAAERVSIYNVIRDSFKMRSHLIHGKRSKLDDTKFHEVVAKTRDHLRNALKKRISEPRKLKPSDINEDEENT